MTATKIKAAIRASLLIGTEIFARDEATPIDELEPWLRAVTGHIADLPHIVAHELIHVQQTHADTVTVLDRAMYEGGADFVAELISGGHLDHVQHVYGDAHEAELKAEFSRALHTTRIGDWFYQGDKSKDRPPDLGYYEGYKIAEAYYRRATDKRTATCAIMHAANPGELLRLSGYIPEH